MRLLARAPEMMPDVVATRSAWRLVSRGTPVDDSVMSRLEPLTKWPAAKPTATASFARARTFIQAAQVLIFDTAFHATIPDYARTYALRNH